MPPWVTGLWLLATALLNSAADHFARWTGGPNGLRWRFGGLLVSAWFSASVAADSYLRSGKSDLVFSWALFFLPSWLAILWFWRPWRRVKPFVLASGFSLLIITLRMTTRAPDISPDLSAAEAQQRMFLGFVGFGSLALLVVCSLVGLLAARSSGSRGDPQD
jgi:hypothetical protein